MPKNSFERKYCPGKDVRILFFDFKLDFGNFGIALENAIKEGRQLRLFRRICNNQEPIFALLKKRNCPLLEIFLNNFNYAKIID